MNGPLREAAVTDPEWAKKEHRREWLIKAITAGVLIALTVGVITLIQNRAQDTQITRIEHSACQEDASSYECQHTKLEAERAANLQTTCAPFHKAGYPCPNPGSPAAERQAHREGHARAKEVQNLESNPVSSAPPSTQGGAKPVRAPHHPGTPGGVKAPHGSGKQTPAPVSPAPEAPSEPASPGASGEHRPDVPAPVVPVGPPASPGPPTTSEVQPGALTPVLEKVCSLTDRLARLC